MNYRKFINELNKDVLSLAQKIKKDIKLLDVSENNLEKFKSQKILTESILKLTSILLQIKKFEKLAEINEESDELDIQILNEYIGKMIEDRKKEPK